MLALVTACACSSSVGGSELIVRIDDVSRTTGRYLTGIHFDYAEERDSIYEDDRIAQWARRAGITVARFPGGNEVNYWDWRNPTGYKKRDFWDEPNLKHAPSSEWMSLDEYLHFVDVSGVAPLIGINLLSGVRNDRIEDSIARAKEQVEYIVSKGYEGAFYYLGNEDTSDMGGLEQAGRIFVRHADVIKQVDPNAKLFWNDNAVTKARLRKFLAVAGRYADGVEFHGKWPYGDGKLTRRVSVAKWQQHFPFSVEKRGRYSEKAMELRRYAAELGYPNLMFANNEYGLAQFTKERFIDFDRYDYALVAIEFLQDLFIGQFDMAAFYSNVLADRPRGGARAERRLINTDFGNRLNPFHFGLEMLSSAQGKSLIRIEGGGPDGYGFGAFSDDQLELFLLNKSSSDNSVSLNVLGHAKFRPSGRMFSLVDTVDHWGELVETTFDTNGSSINVILPSLSYSKIVLAIE
jgi:hypothetical protein